MKAPKQFSAIQATLFASRPVGCPLGPANTKNERAHLKEEQRTVIDVSGFYEVYGVDSTVNEKTTWNWVTVVPDEGDPSGEYTKYKEIDSDPEDAELVTIDGTLYGPHIEGLTYYDDLYDDMGPAVPRPPKRVVVTPPTEDQLLDAIYGNGFNRFVGETFRSVLGDEYLASASDAELLFVTTVTATGIVVGGYYAAPAVAGSLGLTGSSALAVEGAVAGTIDYLAPKLGAAITSQLTDGRAVAPVDPVELTFSAGGGAILGPLASKAGPLVSSTTRKFLPGVANKLDNLLSRFTNPKNLFAKPKVVEVASGAAGDFLPATPIRIITKGEKVADLIQEVAQRTYSSGGLEYAIVSLKNGRRVIVQGGPAGIHFGDDVRRVILHTHPMTTGPSSLDFRMLKQLGQKSSYIYELFGGGLTKFYRK